MQVLWHLDPSWRKESVVSSRRSNRSTFLSPDQAVNAALRMREGMRQFNAAHGPNDLSLKIGIHEGPCLAVLLNERQDFFGHTVNVASRVQGAAKPALAGTAGTLRY